MGEELVILCPGQGAQRVGMGAAWAQRSPEARAVFGRADELLGGKLGAPVSALCFEGPADRLDSTDAAQPAIFAASMASFAGLCAQWGCAPSELPLAASAGLSLGEYTALTIAGAISFEAGLELVALRGAAMQDAAAAQRGGMVALVGADEDSAHAVCERAGEGQTLAPANFNAPGQVVISGDAEACDRAVEIAKEMGLRPAPLAVAGAFHSALMAPAAARLSEALSGVDIRPPRRPVLSNVTGAPHDADPAPIKARLVEQLTRPVRWEDNCRWLAKNAPGVYHELAPGKVLAGLMRRTSRETRVETHDEPKQEASA